MSKIIFRSVLLLVAMGILLMILFRSRSPFGDSNSSYAVNSQKEITRIEFLQDGKKLSLVKEDEKWLINGNTETRKSGIQFILRILKEIKIKSPVSSELFKKDIIEKGIHPVKVRVYAKRKLVKSFLVFKTQSNSYGNIMKMREGSKPFIVYLPGYEGDIGSGFTMNELFWQPYTIFNLMPSEIAVVEFENVADTSSSFSVVNKNQHYAITDLKKELKGCDSALVSRYLSYFTWIPFESWAFDIHESEKIDTGKRQPLYRISVTTTSGNKTSLTLWEKSGSGNDPKIKDTDRLIGKLQNRDELIIVRYFDIDPLIKKRSYFFPE